MRRAACRTALIACLLCSPALGARDAGPVGPITEAAADDGSVPAGAAAANASSGSGAAAAPVPDDPTAATLELDIRTSTLLELAAWCRELGLSEAGSKEELAARLRARFGLGTPAASAAGTTASASGSASASKAAPRSVVVEAAQGTDYFTVEAIGEDYARLRGGVVVSFKNGDAVHRVKAKEVLYNRTRNILSASGGVEYEKTSGDSKEYFKGESLTVDVDNWTGVFLDGASERSKTSSSASTTTAYRFKANAMSRLNEDVTVLEGADVTTAGEGDPYWSLSASRIWLLPGSEWAVSNAVLNVGTIPVLYIPFFYIPGDELVFHPALGYRTREGSYVQTTTYLLGKPKASASSDASIMTMLQADSNEEKRLEGLFLRRTGKPAAADSGASLALLLDAYTNLGYYLGANAAVPKTGAVSKADLSFGLGFSREINYTSGVYTPFTSSDPSGVWDSSNLFTRSVPFRYRFLSTGSMATGNGTLTWNIPLYSDPYINQDFLDRSEDSTWLDMIKTGISASAESSSVDVLGSYETSLVWAYKFEPKGFAPYLNSVNISSLKSSLSVGTRTSTVDSYPSINRVFFYPTKLVPYSIAASLSGTPLSWGGSTASTAKPAAKNAPPAAASSYGEARSPWAEDPKDASVQPDSAGQAPGALPVSGDQSASYTPPALSQSFTSDASSTGPKLSLSYTLTPSSNADILFDDDPWSQAKQVNYQSISSVLLAAKNGTEVSATASNAAGDLSAVFSLSDSAAWQGNSYLNHEAVDYNTADERDASTLRNLNSTYSKSSGGATFTYKPFLSNPVFSATALTYTFRGRIADTTFNGSVDDPSWKTTWGEWNSGSVTSHQAAFDLEALVGQKTQDFKVSTNIAPRPSQIATSSDIRVWRSTTSASASVTELEHGGAYQPVTVTETLDLGKSESGARGSFTQKVVISPEANEVTNLDSTLAYGGLSAAFSASQTVGYSFREADAAAGTSGGWYVSDASLKLRPQTFTTGYTYKNAVGPVWRNRSNYSLNASTLFSFDFQRYTLSYLTFNISATVKVTQFVDFTLAATSKNSVVFRYLQNLPGFNLPVTLAGEQNPLLDLVDSFNFFDNQKRTSSGYKLKTLSMTATHYLGDWTASLGYELTPYLDSTLAVPAYVFNNKVTFLMKWTPVPDIKAKTYNDKDGFAVK